ncbi:MAG: hypothetical protein WAP35_05125 [Solirubrobacterales bacterium]
MQYLKDERGISEEVVRQYRIGFARGGDSPRPYPDHAAFVIPVFSEHGETVTIRRRFYLRVPKEDAGSRLVKVVGLPGHKAALFPGEPDIGPVILVAGEFDALCGRSNGLPTISTTCGASLPAELASRFRYRPVAVMFDAQESEQEAADRVVDRLKIAGADAWRVDLRDRGMRDGEDLTDWFVKYGRSERQLRNLIRASRRRAAA